MSNSKMTWSSEIQLQSLLTSCCDSKSPYPSSKRGRLFTGDLVIEISSGSSSTPTWKNDLKHWVVFPWIFDGIGPLSVPGNFVSSSIQISVPRSSVLSAADHDFQESLETCPEIVNGSLIFNISLATWFQKVGLLHFPQTFTKTLEAKHSMR